jgi:hypothetical protein
MEPAEGFREEDFVTICEHLERLHKLAELAWEFHHEGLERSRLKELIDLLVKAIKHCTGREKLPVIDTLEWLKENVDVLLPPSRPFSLEGLKERLPQEPIFPAVHAARGVARQLAAFRLRLTPPPPPPTLWELVDELDAMVDGFTDELRRHTKVLTQLFEVMRPESIPWVVKFIERNPGHVRSSIGEPLCIWWLGRVLGEVKAVWRNTTGPIKFDRVEVDAASADGGCFAAAEVKISRDREKLGKACEQVAKAMKELQEPERLKRAGFRWVKGMCRPSEAAVVTLYDIGGYKEDLRSELSGYLEDRGIDGSIATIYDINDVKDALKSWRSEAKERYLELFETLSRILETT